MSARRVVIVGGGLAGLSAAWELSELGLGVTILEKGNQCGGKLGSWTDADGDVVEHGVHGWWPNYVNFDDLLRRVNVPQNVLQSAQETVSLFPGGGEVQMKPSKWNLPSPFFLMVHFFTYPRRTLADLISLVRAGLHMLAFDPQKDYHKLDGYTFKSWLWSKGVSEQMFQNFFEPYTRSFAFDSAGSISAAACVSSLHLYLLRHANDVIPRWLRGDPYSLIVGPIVDALKARGVKIHHGVSVTKIRTNEDGLVTSLELSQPVDDTSDLEPSGPDVVGRVPVRMVDRAGGVLTVALEHNRVLKLWRTGEHFAARVEDPTGQELIPHSRLHLGLAGDTIIVRTRAGAPNVELGRIPLTQIPPTGFAAFAVGEVPVLINRASGDGFDVLSPECTHMGCTVAWESGSNMLRCPCHNATFSIDGTVLGGPAQKPLTRYAASVEGDDLVISSRTPEAPIIEADHFVLATDTNAAKRLLGGSFLAYSQFRELQFLGATPALVIRLWLRGKKLLGERTSGFFVDSSFLDTFFVVSNFGAAGGAPDETIVEVQGYSVDEEIDMTNEQLVNLACDKLRSSLNLKEVPIRKFHVLRHHSIFSHHRAGTDIKRPGCTSPIPNLFLAGDWVSKAPAHWNMERAIVSGKQASGAIVRSIGGVGPQILEPPPVSRISALIFGFCRCLVSLGEAFRRWTRGDKRQKRGGPKPVEPWKTTVEFTVSKTLANAMKQNVTGHFSNVDVQMRMTTRGDSLVFNGTAKIDLDSVNTGIRLRDYNIRTLVFKSEVRRYATVEFRGVAPAGNAATRKVNWHGKININNTAIKGQWLATLRFETGGWVSIHPATALSIPIKDLGLNTTALAKAANVLIGENVHFWFRGGVRIQ